MAAIGATTWTFILETSSRHSSFATSPCRTSQSFLQLMMPTKMISLSVGNQHLVSSFLSENFRQSFPLWIGLVYRNNSWVWLDGSTPTFTFWGEGCSCRRVKTICLGEPRNSSERPCAAYRFTPEYAWATIECASEIYVLTVCKALPPP